MAEQLRAALRHPDVVDLLIFGSQAKGNVTGYSDLDAILVVSDETAESPIALRSLRTRVLRAQRAVLRYQPMQHHGFEVVTPTLLAAAPAALAMPEVVFEQSASLFGSGGIPFAAAPGVREPEGALAALCVAVECHARWPSHPWPLHTLVSQFALLPALFEQIEDHRVTKAESFKRVAARYPDSVPAYEALRKARNTWPRLHPRLLVVGLGGLANPWLLIDLWRRGPEKAPAHVVQLLDLRFLRVLTQTARSMAEASRTP